jgi:hypothetical protein
VSLSFTGAGFKYNATLRLAPTFGYHDPSPPLPLEEREFSSPLFTARAVGVAFCTAELVSITGPAGASAPVFVQEAETSWSTLASTTASVATAPFNVETGDILIAIGACSDNAEDVNISDNAGGAISWSLVQHVNVGSYCRVKLWTAVADSNRSLTVTFTRVTGVGGGLIYGGTVHTWRGSDGIGDSDKGNAATGQPSIGLTTVQDLSAIFLFNADWTAQDGTSRTWDTINSITPTSGNGLEKTYFRDSAQYSVYGAIWDDVGAVGAKTAGISAPSGQKWATVAIEILGSVGSAQKSFPPAYPVSPFLHMLLR